MRSELAKPSHRLPRLHPELLGGGLEDRYRDAPLVMVMVAPRATSSRRRGRCVFASYDPMRLTPPPCLRQSPSPTGRWTSLHDGCTASTPSNAPGAAPPTTGIRRPGRSSARGATLGCVSLWVASNLWIELPPGVDDALFAREAEMAGIAISPGECGFEQTPGPFVRLSYAATDADGLVAAIATQGAMSAIAAPPVAASAQPWWAPAALGSTSRALRIVSVSSRPQATMRSG